MEQMLLGSFPRRRKTGAEENDFALAATTQVDLVFS